MGTDRRFKANIYMNPGNAAGFAEDSLVSRRLGIGCEAVLSILERDPRCAVITIDADTEARVARGWRSRFDSRRRARRRSTEHDKVHVLVGFDIPHDEDSLRTAPGAYQVPARLSAGFSALTVIESILLTTCPVSTFSGQQQLTRATGFFFERDHQLFLVTSRHVLRDAPSQHAPDRIEIELHTDPENVAASTGFSIPLYQDGKSVWRQAMDSAGEIDVAAIEIDRTALPQSVSLQAFTPEHLLDEHDSIEVGAPVLIVGFPLGFHDRLHHMPVVRQAILASSFGLRFQGQGYFLTDGRTHRGSSGGPVIMRVAKPRPARRDLPWVLLGVHSARLDVGPRDPDRDEALGLNCAWYTDILLTLTEA